MNDDLIIGARGMQIGDTFTIEGVFEPDRRWWKRLLHRVLRRPPPVQHGVLRKYRVTVISDGCANIVIPPEAQQYWWQE